MSSAGTQSAVSRVRAGTTEQQRLLLKAAVSTPRAVGRKQVVHILPHAGAADPKSKKIENKNAFICIYWQSVTKNELILSAQSTNGSLKHLFVSYRVLTDLSLVISTALN